MVVRDITSVCREAEVDYAWENDFWNGEAGFPLIPLFILYLQLNENTSDVFRFFAAGGGKIEPRTSLVKNCL